MTCSANTYMRIAVAVSLVNFLSRHSTRCAQHVGQFFVYLIFYGTAQPLMYRTNCLSDVIDVSRAESAIAKTKANPVDGVGGGARVLLTVVETR